MKNTNYEVYDYAVLSSFLVFSPLSDQYVLATLFSNIVKLHCSQRETKYSLMHCFAVNKKKLRGFSLRANYTDRVTAAYLRS
jgi:hypothetical protein